MLSTQTNKQAGNVQSSRPMPLLQQLKRLLFCSQSMQSSPIAIHGDSSNQTQQAPAAGRKAADANTPPLLSTPNTPKPLPLASSTEKPPCLTLSKLEVGSDALQSNRICINVYAAGEPTHNSTPLQPTADPGSSHSQQQTPDHYKQHVEGSPLLSNNSGSVLSIFAALESSGPEGMVQEHHHEQQQQQLQPSTNSLQACSTGVIITHLPTSRRSSCYGQPHQQLAPKHSNIRQQQATPTECVAQDHAARPAGEDADAASGGSACQGQQGFSRSSSYAGGCARSSRQIGSEARYHAAAGSGEAGNFTSTADGMRDSAGDSQHTEQPVWGSLSNYSSSCSTDRTKQHSVPNLWERRMQHQGSSSTSGLSSMPVANTPEDALLADWQEQQDDEVCSPTGRGLMEVQEEQQAHTQQLEQQGPGSSLLPAGYAVAGSIDGAPIPGEVVDIYTALRLSVLGPVMETVLVRRWYITGPDGGSAFEASEVISSRCVEEWPESADGIVAYDGYGRPVHILPDEMHLNLSELPGHECAWAHRPEPLASHQGSVQLPIETFASADDELESSMASEADMSAEAAVSCAWNLIAEPGQQLAYDWGVQGPLVPRPATG